ncbi:hypothetical protein LLEC1_03190 [Akanthomyces lecanii]|uniref:Protein transport protein BOS1 n=1 Tax=Cordyceps confragosa TaxID=2714763 RepID=A0A179I8A2_CORDF|nr:hypothetical protein LLEC1_03190 [Akanthomyces lecanii]
MNVVYNAALRQSKAINNDLATLQSKGEASAAEIGNVSVTLATFTKAIDEYNSLARQEIVPKKQDEAFERVKRFRDDLAGFRSRVDNLKKAREEAQHQHNRNELLGRRPYNASSTPENPYASADTTSTVANTLGISGETIRMVERRAREDKWIFAAGVLVFFGFCWLVMRYLR